MTPPSVIDEESPQEAFETLKSTEGSVLVDVRTKAEWDQIGVPDTSAIGRPLLLVEWVSGPNRAPNERFLDEVLRQAGGTLPERMLFVCRSGARSAAAARAVAAAAGAMGTTVHCTNVAEGVEGVQAATGPSGWRARGLPMRDV